MKLETIGCDARLPVEEIEESNAGYGRGDVRVLKLRRRVETRVKRMALSGERVR
jgi:hypothetical protein